MELQRDVLAEQPSEHLRHAADHAVEVERARVDNLLAAKSEQLAREAGGALGGLLDLVGGGERLRIERRQAEQRGVAEDDGEDVVEIVRDAAGELADGLHFLRLAELFFEAFVQRDIAEQAQEQARLAAGLDVAIGDFKNHLPPVVQREFFFRLLLGDARPEILPVALQQPIPVRARAVDHRERPALELFLRQPDQPAIGAVHRRNVSVLISQPHPIHGIFPDRAEQGFRTAQRHLGGVALAHVADVKKQRGLALKIHAHHTAFHGNDAPVRRDAFALEPFDLAGGNPGEIVPGIFPARGGHEFFDGIFFD